MIEFDHVSVTFQNRGKKFLAVSDVTLTVETGEFFGIVGPSGAGKSTLVRTVNRLQRTDSGSIRIDGREITGLKGRALREERLKIGMIFQHFSLLERKTVFENVALPLECFKYPKDEINKRVDELLTLVGIHDKKNMKPRNLSGGQKQRVAIARAIAKNPKLLLCDEPTGALDYNTGKAVLSLLQKMCREMHMTVVVITHNLALTPMGDKVIYMKNGQVEKMLINPEPTPVERIEW